MATTAKTVLITGCIGKGIGNALAREFHAQGFRVFATGLSVPELEDLSTLGIETLALDVTDSEHIATTVDVIAQRTGGTLDILVNNAGIARTIPMLDATEEDIRSVFETNFFAVVYMCKAFAPLLIKAKGNIVQIGSVTQMVPYTFGAMYNASKAALHAFSDTLRVELEPFGVSVTECMTSRVISEITTNSAHAERRLPPDSLYLPVEEYYIQRKSDSLQGALDTATYAKQVVNQVTKSTPPKWYWAGNLAWVVWGVTTFFPRSFMYYLMRNSFGMGQLKEMVKSGKIKL
ncbi:NAD(P)-binding protein [Cylindrobasidium torrendii FP15055 ss-10]|uniref:NAD(P)-binding protein n=1 Tax=Cylindrobasidium torrendii FP15055 ss-10 TaxID=1314674 RepID=A0A0D7BDS5_9AGAR|nr:NAD(P)-binding protein [Cylindrobasidium torrendii FP15055 ss-10]